MQAYTQYDPFGCAMCCVSPQKFHETSPHPFATQLISFNSSQPISFNSSHTSQLTQLISLHANRSTHLTQLISLNSPHSTSTQGAVLLCAEEHERFCLPPPAPAQDYVQGAVLLMTGDQGAVLLCAEEHERFCPPPPLPKTMFKVQCL